MVIWGNLTQLPDKVQNLIRTPLSLLLNLDTRIFMPNMQKLTLKFKGVPNGKC